MTSDWQPIETAPKDGTEIIGCAFHDYGGGYWSAHGPWTVAWFNRKWRSSWDGCEVIEYQGDFGIEYKEPDLTPTHWQPMPTLPRGEGK